jgi:hypothetical protein
MNALQPLCNSRELVDGGQAVPFDVNYAGQTCRAFAVRFQGLTHAYLNRCSHVAMELDWQPNQVFDESGHGCCAPATEPLIGPIPDSARAVRAGAAWSKSRCRKVMEWCIGMAPTTSNR